ncbi:MAG: GNAT family N-acetyltransferase [Streptosporangiaceae bacterium]
MADPYTIRPISPDEFDAFHAVDQQAFFGQPPGERTRAALVSQLDFGRTLAAFDDGIPVGNTAAWSLRLCLPGGMAPVAGVTLVAVLPTHRRRGIASSLMRRQLAGIRERGEAIAALWASEAEIYGRFGYGPATWQANFSFRRGDGVLRPEVRRGLEAAVAGGIWTGTGTGTGGGGGGGGARACGGGGLRLRIAEPEMARAEMCDVYQEALPGRPGMFARADIWWDRVLRTKNDSQDDIEPLRCVLAENDSGTRGYAIYTGKLEWDAETFLADGSVHVRELIANDPAACALLWGDLLSRDLVTEVTASLRPADDPVVHLLADPRRARRQVSDGLWVRLTDVPQALGLRRYSCPVDVTVEVGDALLPENAGVWRLVASGEIGMSGENGVSGEAGVGGFGAVCEAGGGAADLTLDVAARGAAYLGGTRLGELAGAGLVTEHRPGAVAALSAALAWDPAPWCPIIF